MRKLTNYQKKYILDNYFKPMYDEYPGILNIGEVLLTEGVCIVPDDGKHLFRDNIGLIQYVKRQKVTEENIYGCIEYVFNLDEFLDSYFFKKKIKRYYQKLEEEYVKQLNMKNEIFDLIGEKVIPFK